VIGVTVVAAWLPQRFDPPPPHAAPCGAVATCGACGTCRSICMCVRSPATGSSVVHHGLSPNGSKVSRTVFVLWHSNPFLRWLGVAQNGTLPLSMHLGSYASFHVIERSLKLFVLVAASLSHQQDFEFITKALLLKLRPVSPH
jgi:hypothetical protein